jgi:hypothetical protein
MKFWKVEIKSRLVDGISVQEMVKYPFPIVIFNFIEKDTNAVVLYTFPMLLPRYYEAFPNIRGITIICNKNNHI